MTPKGTKPGVPRAAAPAPGSTGSGSTGSSAGPKRANTPSSRYTPPTPKSQKSSPPWWPYLMFGLLGVGALLIIVNYMELIWGANPILLFVGLAFILGGIVVATKLR